MTGRRWLTWLVVAGLSVIGLAAAVDALRRRPEVVRTKAETATVPGGAADSGQVVAQLRQAGVSGVLTYSDEDCQLHAVSLPELEPVEGPSFEMCRPVISNGGLGVVDGDVVWSGLGYRFAQVVLYRRGALACDPGWARGADGGFRAVQAVRLTTGACSCSRLPRAPGARGRSLRRAARAVRAPELAGRQCAGDSPKPAGALLRDLPGRAAKRTGVHPRRAHRRAHRGYTPGAWAVAWSPDERVDSSGRATASGCSERAVLGAR